MRVAEDLQWMAGVDTMDWKTRYESLGVYVILTGQMSGGGQLLT